MGNSIEHLSDVRDCPARYTYQRENLSDWDFDVRQTPDLGTIMAVGAVLGSDNSIRIVFSQERHLILKILKS